MKNSNPGSMLSLGAGKAFPTVQTRASSELQGKISSLKTTKLPAVRGSNQGAFHFDENVYGSPNKEPVQHKLLS